MLWDIKQTLTIKNHPNLHEMNLLMGQHPSDITIIVYFIAYIGLYIFLSLFLLKGIALYIWLAICGISEIKAITGNIKNGL